MSGDVDLSDNWNLALATPRIRGTGAHTIFVDVAAVTFFGSTIVNFLVHLLAAGSRSEVVLCRGRAMASQVIGRPVVAARDQHGATICRPSGSSRCPTPRQPGDTPVA